MAQYVIVSTAVIDEIHLAGGEDMGARLGGAGVYALGGIGLWTPSAVLVTGVGEDFSYRWFEENGCATEGLRIKDAHTAISQVQYQADGERVETPRYGSEHYQKLEATPDEIAPFLPGARGVYLFKDLRPGYWEQILAYKRQYGFALEWELNADAAKPACCEQVRQIAQQCDVFSLNRTEALSLLGADTLEQACKALLQWKTPLIFLRNGARGALMLHSGQATAVPSVPDVQVQDPTGAGNASTAAVLYGYCTGRSAAECGLMGSISAAHTIAQYGPPALDEAARAAAKAELAQLREQYEKTVRRDGK